MSGGEKVVIVTGASGYIASWVVKLLLHRGYLVRATVRDPNDATKTEHLLAMDGAKERLQLFKADLLEEGSFDSAVEGSECVFHTASPVNLSPQDPQAELIDPAVKGTLNVLRSCAKYSVKRVVLTSSMAAVAFIDRYVGGETVDETWFSDPAFCEQSKLWYMLSKTLAEEAAWKFSKDEGINLVTINPGLVIGPLLQPTLNFSVKVVVDIIKGVGTFVNSHRYVDVRDVAFAHVQAFEIASANGRYCLVERVAHRSEALRIIHKLYPSLKSLTQCEDEVAMVGPVISKEKASSLGMSFIPLEVSLRDTLESLKLKGFLNF